MHRNIIILLLALLVKMPFLAQAQQDADPVTWTTEVKKTAPNEYDLIFTANLEKGWHIYSQFIEAGGPVPTSFNFTEGKYKKTGTTEETGHPEKIFDEGFEMNLVYFSGKSDFIQHVKLTGPTTSITGYYEFMICNDEMCLPPKKLDFSFPLMYEPGTK